MTMKQSKFDTPVRAQFFADVSERILTAGTELLRAEGAWDWREVTIRAVAKRAQVSERTVYRHFTNERGLQEAIIRRLNEVAGVPLDGFRLEAFPDQVIERIYKYLAPFSFKREFPKTAATKAEEMRWQKALRGAIEPYAQDWSETERRMATGLLDVLKSVEMYERLRDSWDLDTEDAMRAAKGLSNLLIEAIRQGGRPWDGDER